METEELIKAYGLLINWGGECIEIKRKFKE